METTARAQHTRQPDPKLDMPGPKDWRATDEFVAPNVYNTLDIVDDHAEMIVATVFDVHNGGFGRLHANLIAAAPALLAALQRFADCREAHATDGICREDHDELIRDADAAIAQARGDA